MIFAVLTGIGVSSQPARALNACSATNITTQDPGCPPGLGPCNISKTFSIADTCTLDFGNRAVTVLASGLLSTAPGSVTLLAGSLTIAPGGLIEGRGDKATAPDNVGTTITIITTGAVTLQKSATAAGRIDVSATLQGGVVFIDAGGSVSLAGRINANQLATTGGGGTVSITAAGDIVTQPGSAIDAGGGSLSLGGGEVDLTATGAVTLGGGIDVTGSEGGTVNVAAGESATIAAITANGAGDGGSGGNVTVSAGTSVQVGGKILLQGVISTSDSGGGSGGTLTIEADYGGVSIGADILAEGALPDGDGGEIDLFSRGTTQIPAGTTISVRSNGAMGVGGDLSIDAGLKVTHAGKLDASGGAGGGDIEVTADSDITIAGLVESDGRAAEGTGGTVTIIAGNDAFGNLTITNTVDVTGGSCDLFGCGQGGATDIEGCNITVQSTGKILARGPFGGQNQFVAREQFTLSPSAVVTALKTVPSGSDGANEVQYPTRKPPSGTSAMVPATGLTGMATCASGPDTDCLLPCPVCGNGIVEFPEQCDNNVGTPLGCDGCDNFCDFQDCDSGDPCAVDSCDPLIGCRSVPLSPCLDTPTPTNSPGPTNTPTATFPTHTPTETPVIPPSATPAPASATPTVSPTRTITPTPLSFHDSVVLPVAPISVRLARGNSMVTRSFIVTVVNADVYPKRQPLGHIIQLVASDGDCPPGTVAGPADFQPRMAGAQDAVFLSQGRGKKALVSLHITRDSFTSFNKRAPRRCTLVLRADDPIIGNADPSPENNVTTVELNVIDRNDPDETALHESVIDSVLPVNVLVKKGASRAYPSVAIGVSNADVGDIGGHVITVLAADGSCPPGTVGTGHFRLAPPLPQNAVVVRSARTVFGDLPITIDTSGFHSPTRKSPARCTAILTAVGPSGDSDPGNNVTKLVINVTDRNDF